MTMLPADYGLIPNLALIAIENPTYLSAITAVVQAVSMLSKESLPQIDPLLSIAFCYQQNGEVSINSLNGFLLLHEKEMKWETIFKSGTPGQNAMLLSAMLLFQSIPLLDSAALTLHVGKKTFTLDTHNINSKKSSSLSPILNGSMNPESLKVKTESTDKTNGS